MKFQYPKKQGLYDPQFEHDSCGVGFVVHIKNHQSHEIVEEGLNLLCNLDHRGALGADPNSGDGSGIMIQIPHQFFVEECLKEGFYLPDAGEYGIASIFLPKEPSARRHCGEVIESHIVEKGMDLLGWRDVPRDLAYVGKQALSSMPEMRHLFMGYRRLENYDQEKFERKLYITRKAIRTSLQDVEDFIIASMSSRTIVYKGMLIPNQMRNFFTDLSDTRLSSAMALVHTRFPTNTFPRWDLAQPFRNLAHNGEINSLRGNINWMRGRRVTLDSNLYEDISEIQPIIIPRGSDSACLDNVFEFLIQSGFSLSHAMMMLIPEAWEYNAEMASEKKAFYEFHDHLMEPWDGPASLIFTDGIQIGATLDRNGLRPSRYVVTKDDKVIMGSEVGPVDIDPANINFKGRLKPGKMFLVDTKEGRIVDDTEIKKQICSSQPYSKWLKDNVLEFSDLQKPTNLPKSDLDSLITRQKIFGYTTEDLNLLLTPMIVSGTEASGSMGNDTPLAVLSERPRLLFDYFKQIFAQVSNPPVDAIREELVMSLTSRLGPQKNILDPSPSHARMLKVHHPVIDNEQLAQVKSLNKKDFKSTTLRIIFKENEGKKGFSNAINKLCQKAENAVNSGSTFLILSDRGVGKGAVPIPSLLAVAAVHHYLILKRKRHKTGLIVETGEAREISHFCLLVSYGAGAINPYLAFETFEQMIKQKSLPKKITLKVAKQNYFKAIKKGMFKVFSKMGISTIQSYRGAQIFEAIGLDENLIQEFFAGTPSRISGIGLDEIALETILRYEEALNENADTKNILPGGGYYNWRRRGEYHQVNPVMSNLLQEAVRKKDQIRYEEFSNLVNEHSKNFSTPRNLFDFAEGTAILQEEVEPASEIVKRFVTGAMSFGSISQESHETLAIAMNRIDARSNSGEGGEDSNRFKRQPNGDLLLSKVKQVASGRFGVTINYLVNCTEIQIKVAQGAKPGEGGQLPGNKVSKEIAKVRNSTPGVTLISPPPHHDIYSIEDLAQLIFDLKNANPEAKINVKLVAEAGVGTISAGVAKAHADIITIAGHDGGTGASPLTSIKHAGVPWELGLSEAHQTLMLNDLRGRVRLQTDGQLKTGRDVAVAAFLGAEEYGFATMPLIAIGCIMMRKCHLNTCPVGIATQNPELRKKFSGKPEHLINYFFFVAEEVRKIMSRLGFRKIDDMIGRTDMLKQKKDIKHWKAKKVDLSSILFKFPLGKNDTSYCTQEQDHGLEKQLDHELIKRSKVALENKKEVKISLPICNVNRSVGTMLSSKIAKKYGEEGLPDNTIHCKFNGSAGQSFGAFLSQGVTLELEGEANDYTAKGLSGGRLIIYPPKKSTFIPEENIIIGNTVLYGATSGEVFFSGIAGERFAVRNSGAIAVVEGIGDHGCEYMTGGKVIVLGETGKNFAAGMSGGIAYVLDENKKFNLKCNTSMVDLEIVNDHQEELWLKKCVERHQRYTGSSNAKNLLANWDQIIKRFVKVMPLEYRAVLESIKNKAA